MRSVCVNGTIHPLCDACVHRPCFLGYKRMWVLSPSFRMYVCAATRPLYLIETRCVHRGVFNDMTVYTIVISPTTGHFEGVTWR